MTRRLIALALAVGLAVSPACTSGDETDGDGSGTTEARPPTEPPGWQVVDGPAALEPLGIEEEPLWRSDSVRQFQLFGSGAFRGDSLLMWGGERSNWRSEYLGVVDAPTGEVRWVVDEELPGGNGARLWSPLDALTTPAIVDHGDGWAVLVAYELPGDGPTEYGLAALSGEDGRVLWKSPVVTGESPGTSVQGVYVGDGFAVVVAAAHRFMGDDLSGDPQLVAVRTTDGSRLWEQPDMDVVGVTRDTVLGYVANEGGEVSTSWLAAGSIVGLDPASGEVRWNLANDHDQSGFVLADGDLALVRVPRNRGVEQIVIEARSGREVASFGTPAPAGGCAAGDRLIACSVESPSPGTENGLATLQVDDREASVSEAVLPERTIEAVVDGRILLSDSHRPPWVSVDRFANTIDAGLRGAYLAGSDRYAIFQSEFDVYAVHRITG